MPREAWQACLQVTGVSGVRVAGSWTTHHAKGLHYAALGWGQGRKQVSMGKGGSWSTMRGSSFHTQISHKYVGLVLLSSFLSMAF